jgi:integrase
MVPPGRASRVGRPLRGTSELVTLRWEDVDFTTGRLHVRRAKGGETAVHRISGKELRALRRLQRESERGNYIFVSERGAPLSVAGYQRMVARAGAAAGSRVITITAMGQLLIAICGCKDRRSGYALNASLAAPVEDTRRVAPRLRGHSRQSFQLQT